MLSLSTRLGEPLGSENRKGEVRYNCPFCPSRIGKEDTSYHLYVNERKGKFRCVRCNTGGPFAKLQELLGFEIIALDDDQFQERLQASLEPPRPVPIVKELARDYHALIPGGEAYRYLESRWLDAADIEYWHIGMGTANLFELPREEWDHYAGRGRIVVPDHDAHGDIEYWVARSYTGQHKAKYKNAPYSALDQVLDLARAGRSGSGYLVIVEGPFDCMVASKYLQRSVVATYGKNVTDEKVIRLLEEGPHEGHYYVALDPDASQDAERLAARLHARGAQVSLVQMPNGEDPGSLGPRIRDYVERAQPYDRF